MHCCHTMQTVFLISLLVVLSSCNPIWQQKTLKDIQSCSSPVYCQGPLLDTVQRAQIFNDSKTFVDMSQVNSVNITLENFWKLMNATDGTPTRQDIIEFVNANFLSQNETVPWTPPDFNENPSLINKIQDQNVREFTQNLIKIWPTLGRKISPDVYQNPDQHSILEVPNGFVVPGGRFKELYYWDSLWIVKGLLISEMYDTVKGMLENMCYLINQIGFMPNGSRNYFLNRSQPPALTLMIQEYLKYTKNTAWVNEIVGCVESELTFWLENHTKLVEKDGEVYELAHFESESNTPRPESYDKDLKTCSSYSEETEKKLCYKSLKSGAETGWDFSTRWFFDDNGGTDTNLTHIRPQRVVPVDLNAFLCKAFADLAEFYAISGEPHKEALWQERSNIWQKSIEMVLYNKEEGIWLDYDPILQKSRNYFYPSNFAPLWAETYNLENKEEYGKRAAEYFQRQGIEQFLGGIPTSLVQSGEQWDFTNAWPPLQEYVVLGLFKTGNNNATEIAQLFAKRWVSANMIGYNENQIMFEKYDAVNPGKFGGGGEYVVQSGFGWTNGVALSFIDTFYTNK